MKTDKMEQFILQMSDRMSYLHHWKSKIASPIGSSGDVQERVFKQNTELRESC